MIDDTVDKPFGFSSKLTASILANVLLGSVLYSMFGNWDFLYLSSKKFIHD